MANATQVMEEGRVRRARSRMTALSMASMLLSGALSACGEVAKQSVAAGTGPEPTLLAPKHTLIPTLHIAPEAGWPVGAKPVTAAGLQVNAYAAGLSHPRWLYVLPNGDVLVAETNAPAKPDDAQGLKGWIMSLVMKRAGAATPSANRITLLRDAHGQGVASERSVLLQGLNSPFGMVLVGHDLYVADSDAVRRFPYAEVDVHSGTHRIFASGLRNPNGLAWQPQTGALWTAVNERDELGSDLVPDYMTAVHDGAFYGWPYSSTANMSMSA
jgi:glucose/arabinose dehydrogenase